MADAPSNRAVIVAPDFGAHGGIQHVARLVGRSLQGVAQPALDVSGRALFNGAPAGAAMHVWSAHGSRLRLGVQLLRDAAHSGPDTLVIVMHIHLAPLLLPAALAGARVVLWLHGVEIDRPLSRSEASMARRAWKIVAVSRHTAALWERHNPRLSPATVCHLGVADCARVASARGARPRALIVGRMAAEERYKGHDTLIDLWPQVRAAIPEATLIVAGEGDDRARLEERVRAAGLRDAIRFVGALSDDQLRLLYEDAACYVMPSTREGFGLAFIEAMRAGRACVAAPGPAEEILQDGISGFIVPPDQRERLVCAVIRLLGDSELRTRMGEAARRRFEAAFSETRFAERFRGALQM